MNRIKIGDVVGRISYNKDIFFIVKKIENNENVILNGIFERIIADSTIYDLELIEKNKILEYEKNTKRRIDFYESRFDDYAINGKILHLDGDKKYSEKSFRYYKKMGINAIVKNIPESKQPLIVYRLLKIYNPDILVITGHDRNVF